MDSLHPKPAGEAAADLISGCLRRGGAVLAGNARAARALARSYGEAQRAGGANAWRTPEIHDWESWLSILWNQHLLNTDEAPLLLSPLQERAVWKRIVGAEAVEPESIAKLAAGAWKLLSEYNSHGERRDSWLRRATADTEAFRIWAFHFDRQCRNNRWMSRSDLGPVLSQLIGQGRLQLPPEILLAGFDRIAPAQRALLDAAEAQGCRSHLIEAANAETSAHIVQANDFRDELATCAGWLRRKFELNPTARVAVIVQEIDAARGEIDRALRRILMPQTAGVEGREPMPYEFSLGQPLATIPVVKAALLLLRWLVEPLAQAELSWLMLSGFFAADCNHLAEMAALDAEMRKHGSLPPEAPLEAVASYRPKTASTAARAFFAMLRNLQRLAASEGLGQRTKTIPDWLEFCDSAWRQANWPGARALDSLEFQALNRWEKLIGDLSALGFDESRVSYSQFATMIDLYAGETIFAPESRDAPIQIMGAFESAGQHFDAVWFLGADDRQWPPAGQTHPLLPQWLQRQAAMPHAAIEADWRLAQEITQRIAASAPECVFSYAERDEAGELRPSPALRGRFATPTTAARFRSRMHLPINPHPRVQTASFEDSPAIPWPREVEAGGAEILRRQSACPFQSFATRRLGAEELNISERGLTARDRGNILHDVLQSLWSAHVPGQHGLRDRADLLNARANGGLPAILDFHIETIFNQRRGAYERSAWTRQYLRVEGRRLKKVLLQWLDYEAARVDFTVAEREKQSTAEISGLKLSLRVDRVDLVTGGHLVLDYKTGNVSPGMWDGERPDDPQLPLYAIHGGIEDLRGVLFAKIRTGDMGFEGKAINATVTVANKLGPNHSLVKDPLDEETLGEWCDALSSLADDFLAGNAAVAPKSYPKTCKYCPLPSLCRVAETTTALEADDAEEEADNGSGSLADE